MREREYKYVHCSNGEEGEQNEREGISKARIAIWHLLAAAEVEACDDQAKPKDDKPDCTNNKEGHSSVSHRLHPTSR